MSGPAPSLFFLVCLVLNGLGEGLGLGDGLGGGEKEGEGLGLGDGLDIILDAPEEILDEVYKRLKENPREPINGYNAGLDTPLLDPKL